MSKLKIQGPYYGCGQGDCSCECTYPAKELTVYRGEIYCWECLEEQVPFEVYDGNTEPFIPPQEATIKQLQAELFSAAAANKQLIADIKYLLLPEGEQRLQASLAENAKLREVARDVIAMGGDFLGGLSSALKGIEK